MRCGLQGQTAKAAKSMMTIMPQNSDAFSETFIAGLRRDISRWKAELSLLDVGEEVRGAYLQTSELKSWIEEGEAIFARYERRRT
jgi:hypothetical protein